MKCNNCGYELNDNWNVCPNCGASTDGVNSVNNSTGTNTEKNKQVDITKNQEGQNVELQSTAVPNSPAPNPAEKTPSGNNIDEEKIYLIVYLVGFFAGAIFSPIRWFAFLVAIASIVTGFIRCPKSTLIKIFFWITVALVALWIIYIIAILVMCASFGSAVSSTCMGS